MPTLHGFSFSNSYNIPKHALLYKGVEFDEDLVYPNVDGYDALSPARKVPSLTTDDGKCLSEAAVLCEYIEEAYPEKPLFPSDVFARNKCRQLMHMAELYLELPNRRLIPFALTSQAAPEKMLEEIKGVVQKGINSVTALATFDPWVLGSEFSCGDIFLYHVLGVADMGGAMTGIDLDAQIPGLKAWRETLAADPISQRIASDMSDNREWFFEQIQSLS